MANRILNTLVSLLSFAVVARLISREDMGGLGILVLVASAAQVVAGLGLSSTATRFVASLEASGDWLSARRAGYECLLVNSTVSVLLALATYASADFLASALLGSASRALLPKLLSLEIAAIGINYLLISVLTGLRKFREIFVADSSTFIVRQTLVVLFLELGWGLPGVVLGWGIGDGLSLILLSAYVRRYLGPPTIGFGLRKLLRFSSPLYLGESVNYLWSWFDRVLLVPLVSLAQFGVYNVAVTAYGVLNSLPTSVSTTLLPFYSHLYSETAPSETGELENAVKTASRYVSFLTIPLSVGLAVTSLPAATLFAGNAYADAALPLAILSLSLALACQARALSQIFVVLGKSLTSALVTIASVLFSVAIGFLMISQFGIIGASIARGLALIIALLLSVQVLRGILRIRFDMKAYKVAWIASFAMASAVLLLQVAYYNKYLLPIYMVIGAAVYVLSLRLLHAIEREDLELLSEFLGSRLKPVSRILGTILAVESNDRDH